jgi:inner membrane protein
MFVLGHTGIALGATVLLNGILPKSISRLKRSLEPLPEVNPASNYPRGRLTSWLTSLGDRIDIRLLLIGSLLPDIIDKPVGVYLFRGVFNSGRIFGHTLLFLIVIGAVGFFLYRSYGRKWLLVLSLGTFLHLITDEMWLDREILLWPLYGFAFPEMGIADWRQEMWRRLFAVPGIYIPEIVGGVILVLFVWVVVRNRKVFAFIRDGKLR